MSCRRSCCGCACPSIPRLKYDCGLVRVVHHHRPLNVAFIQQPSVYHAQHVCLRFIPAGQSQPPRDIPITLFKSRRATRVHPEHPSVWMSLADPIGVLDRDLRLAFSGLSGPGQPVITDDLTRLLPVRQAQYAFPVHSLVVRCHPGEGARRNRDRGGRG